MKGFVLFEGEILEEWVDRYTYIIISCNTGKIITANRDHAAADSARDSLAEFDPLSTYRVRMVDLH